MVLRIKSSLALFLVLTGLTLLSSCKSELKVRTNVAELDCAVLIDDTYCIKVRNGQINSVKDLAIIEDQILTGASGFSLSWTMPATAKGILATKIVLASDAACTEEVKSAEIDSKEQVYTFADIKDGIYYGCVFAKARAAGLLGANNNGIKILVEAAKPKIVSQSEVFYSNGKGLDQEWDITSLSALTYEWTKVSGPGELSFSPAGSATPTITASVDGRYTFDLTATNEVGGRSTKTFTLIYDSMPPVLKAIAPILTSAESVAIQAESEEDLALYRWELIRAPGDATPALKDANSATAELSLPSLGLYELKVSLSDQAGNIGSTRVLITKEAPAAPPVDTTHPSAPSAITVAAYTNTASISASYTAGSDANFSTHNVKACAASDCSTACLSVSQDIASPVTVSSLLNGSAYYICLQAVDLSGNVSAYVASDNSVTVDTTAPLAPSALGFGSSLTTSTTLSLAFAVGTDTNFGAHDTRLCTTSDCSAGCGSIVQSVSSPVSLTGTAGATYYGCARSRDLAGNTSSWIASIGTMTIDSTNPTAPSAIAWAAGYSNSTAASLSWTDGSDSNFSTHNLKACTDSGCSTSCTAETQDASTPGSIVGMSAGSTYYACIQSIDLAGNASAFVASAGTVTIDTTVPLDPTVVSVPVASNGNFNISFTAGAETYPSSFHIMACTSGCTVGCVGATSTASSPGTISGAALTNGNSYHGCVQGTDLAGNSSGWVPSVGLVIFDTMAPNGASDLLVPAYSSSSSVAATFTVGTDAHMSTHNVKACTSNNCSTGCLAEFQTASSPATLTSLVDGTAYYACAQAVDLAGNTSGFSFSPAPVTIDSTNPGNPSSVSVPASSASNFNISFTGGTESNPGSYNIKACINSDCATGCVGETTTASSPGTISAAALTLGNSYYGCVQGTDLAGNTSSFVASAGSVLYNSLTVTYSGSANTGGSVPIDATGYASGTTVTVLGNTGGLVKTGYSFAGWNTLSNGTGNALSPGQTFSITAHTTLYAQWTVDCSSLAGGTYVMVPGDADYATSSFCVQKYVPSNVGGVPTSQTGTQPWANIAQTSAISTCASLGAGYHLITNPEWMTVAANLANVGSNWSGGIVGSGTLRRGHSDGNPYSACAAHDSEANAYVETDCTGTSSGSFIERRTSTLSNGVVVWDIGGNVWSWLNYINLADKPTPATMTWYEYTAITGSTTTPRAHLVPLYSVQSWWNDSWNSVQGIGKIWPDNNGSGGGLLRGGYWGDGAYVGAFSVQLYFAPSAADSRLGFRCAYTPNTFAIIYNANSATSGIPPNDPTLYASGNTVTVKKNALGLTRTGFTFAGWNTLADGTGTNYTPGGTFTISANTTLYARWIDCSALAGGTWVAVPGDSVYGTNAFCVQKYAASDVGGVATSQAGSSPWISTRANAITQCSALGAGYHLITNSEWMTITANLANVGSNWSGGSVGSGTLRRGHSDSNPGSTCAADAVDANGYVHSDCTGTSSGTFIERRTSSLSNSAVVWDIGGNIFQWIDYSNSSDKPTPATAAWYEFSAMTWTATTPKSHMLPLNSVQSWWNESWNSATGIGNIYPGINGSGGDLLRGGGYCSAVNAGPFAAYLNASNPTCSGTHIGFRCAKTP